MTYTDENDLEIARDNTDINDEDDDYICNYFGVIICGGPGTDIISNDYEPSLTIEAGDGEDMISNYCGELTTIYNHNDYDKICNSYVGTAPEIYGNKNKVGIIRDMYTYGNRPGQTNLRRNNFKNLRGRGRR
ncbi:MAG: hypothetical protein IJQ85_00160 [Selenomonadaceae bacterium]|nr:hypothetical protein [Selenomonadaceae bacterium]